MNESEDDVALKLLHTADWHLGMRFPSFSEEDELELMRARMEVIERIFCLAESNAVDAVLCAGDLFDNPQPDETWWKGLLDRLSAHDWSRRPVFLLPGNHDPLTGASIYRDARFVRSLPRNVHVVDRSDFTAELGGGVGVLYAVPCTSAAGQIGMWEKIPPRGPGDERIRIGMVHGQTFDIPGYQTNFPLPEDAPVQRGLDYLAIGDTHAFREIPEGARYPMVYPSAPEPTKFGELDSGYVALVFCPRGRRRVIVRREKVGYWRWEQREITSVAELQALAERTDLKRVVLRLRLHLKVSPPELERVEILLRRLQGTDSSRGLVGVMQVDRSALEIDTRDVETVFEDLPDVLGATVRRLQRKAEEVPQASESARRALYHLYRLVKETR